MPDEIRRESFADEASYLQFQANWLEMQRSANWHYAVEGRDYDTIKHINRRIKLRLYRRKRYAEDEEYREHLNERGRASYARNRERRCASVREYNHKHSDERHQYNRWRYNMLKQDGSWVAFHNRRRLEGKRRLQLMDPTFNMRYASYSRKWCQKKQATDPDGWTQYCEHNKQRQRQRRANDATYRAQRQADAARWKSQKRAQDSEWVESQRAYQRTWYANLSPQEKADRLARGRANRARRKANMLAGVA